MNLFIINANALHIPLPDKSVQMCVTSPPYYGLRDYGTDNQIGLEQTPDEYVTNIVKVFREVWRVMKDDGVLWLNLGDSYANNGVSDPSKVGGFTGDRIRNNKKGIMDSRPKSIPQGLKPKDLIGIPWRVAFALQADGWYLRQDIIWHKPNPMPESVKDRCTKSHEYIFLLSKQARYYYDADAINEPTVSRDDFVRNRDDGKLNKVDGRSRMGGLDQNNYEFRNKRSVWTVTTKPYSGAHFATFPQDLIEPCIKAGSRENDTVLDPFNGSGTTGEVCARFGRNYIGIELNREYIELTNERLLPYRMQPSLI